jgi:DNA-directed RNA polymerase specialized sigma24 family protein
VSAASAPVRYADFDVDRDYERLRGPLLGLLRRDGWTISDDEWDTVWNAVCANVWRRQQASPIDFRGEPLNYLLATAKNELRRERRRPKLDAVSLDADGAPEPVADGPELDDELELRDKLRIAQTIARNRLRPRELRVWGLRIVCGLTYEEGAARLGLTPKRFEKDLMSAHAKIADEIRAVAAGTWCDSVKGVSLLRAYEEGVLDPDGAAVRELREHARTCPACRRAMKAVEGIVPLLLPPAPVLLAATAPGGDTSVEHAVRMASAIDGSPVEHGVRVLVGSDGGTALEHRARLFAPLRRGAADAWQALGAPRRAAAELWHAIAGSPAGASAVQAGGEGGAAATTGGLSLLGVAGGKALVACITAGALGTCLTVAALDPPSVSHHHRHHRATHHRAKRRAVTPPVRAASRAPAPSTAALPRTPRRAPSVARAAVTGARRSHVFQRRSRAGSTTRSAATSSSSSSASGSAGGEFQGQSFESQSSSSSAGASSAGRSSGGGGGGSAATGSSSSSSKPSGGEFSSEGFEK